MYGKGHLERSLTDRLDKKKAKKYLMSMMRKSGWAVLPEAFFLTNRKRREQIERQKERKPRGREFLQNGQRLGLR